MTPFTRLIARAAVLPRAHVDTDQIIPKQFLTRVERTGYGHAAFFDWRWLSDGRPDPTFELNHPDARGAAILLTGENFGCGSSREHAAWALRDMGFRAVVAPSFAEIFAENATNTGILPARVDAVILAEFMALAATGPVQLTIDLAHQRIHGGGRAASFDILPFRRERLLRGLDPIGLTLQHDAAITAFEGAR